MEKRKYKRLHYEDRQTIEAMSKQGSSVKDIAEALGTHRDATKERCLEVLDEIQKACVSYLFTAGGAAVIRGGMDVQPFAAVIPRLYEMPEK